MKYRVVSDEKPAEVEPVLESKLVAGDDGRLYLEMRRPSSPWLSVAFIDGEFKLYRTGFIERLGVPLDSDGRIEVAR